MFRFTRFTICKGFMELSDKKRTCFFTGHRKIIKHEREKIIFNTEQEVKTAFSKGYSTFISGGAIGFDMLGASVILKLKKQGLPINLKMVLPCTNQSQRWSEKQKSYYEMLMTEADSIERLEFPYENGCMKYRNERMVELSSLCIAYLRKNTGGTAQTVRLAHKAYIKIAAF